MVFKTASGTIIVPLVILFTLCLSRAQVLIEVDTTTGSIDDSLVTPTQATGDSAAAPTPEPIDSLELNAITIEGLVLDSVTGVFSAQDSISVYIDSQRIALDHEGNFSVTISRSPQYHLAIYSGGYILFSRTIPDDPQKPNLFVTCLVSKKKAIKTDAPGIAPVPMDGMPWTISGCIVDSRLDLTISSPGAYFTFDDSMVALSSKGSFTITTRFPGNHTFHLQVPGYHEVFENVVLNEQDKQPFITIATTEAQHALKRREITVSAKRQQVHTTATVAAVTISRKQLLRATATVNDPVRVLNTLPGVASESDVSAAPIVRGGDMQEARVSLDGISLLQPFHFGGARSIFNTQSIENLTLYKSGFPAEYHNAQSGLIVAQSRSPARDSAIITADINLMQYCFYAGTPLNNHTMGLNLAVQGSYLDFITQRVFDVILWNSRDSSMKQSLELNRSLINQPDYKDASAGFEWRPSDRLGFSVNEVFASDKMRYANGDSVTPATYYYSHKLYYYDKYGRFRCFDGPTGNPVIDEQLRDTSFSYTLARGSWDSEINSFACTPDSIQYGRPYFEIDTLLYYKSAFNLLYAKGRYIRTADQIFTLSLAWQKRWWDLVFPEELSNMIDRSHYDVSLDQCNAHAGMLYAGKKDHLVKCGLQWDLTRARYDVFTFRMLHEIIARGSTNYGDYWGPVTNDTGLTMGGNGETDGFNDNSWELIGRLLVSYKGSDLFHNGSLYGEDEWTPTPRLTCNYGVRVEVSGADRSATISPRVSLKYQWLPNHELIVATGLYTQNNYDVAALALSEDLKPEKVWHASVGAESKLLPWLAQKIDLYGKYYFDLTSEEIRPVGEINAEMLARADAYIKSKLNISNIDSLKTNAPEEYANLVMVYLIQREMFSSHYSNEGRGWAAGGEYSLRYDPADFWDGWISFTLGKSMRQRHPGWRWHDFPYERPLLISLVNYYRLPRKYEIGVKYRFMSGIPYTPVTLRNGVTIGAYNSRRFSPYQSLDLKIAKGFGALGAKCHFYIEVLNMLNTPNMFLTDSETRELKMMGMNLPFTAIFIGLDVNNL